MHTGTIIHKPLCQISVVSFS